MLDWDYDLNNRGTGSLSIYHVGYDDIEESKISFLTTQLKSVIKDVEDSLLNLIEHDKLEDFEEEDDEPVVGINSNSFTGSMFKHNIFLEWDKTHFIPPFEHLRSFDGIITKTRGGFHLIKEASISINELIELQVKENCCPGFISNVQIKKFSTLRIVPKLDNKLEILQYRDGLLYNIYKELVEKLGDVYESVRKKRH